MQSFALLFLGITLINGCCKEEEIARFEFSNQDLALVPYSATETLTYKDSLGNSITFTGQYRKSDFDEVSDCKGGCCDYYTKERNNTRFLTSSITDANGRSKDMEIIIQHWLDEYDKSKANKTFSITLPDYSGDLNSSTNYGISMADGYLVPANNAWHEYHDTLVIGNVAYYGIFECIGSNALSTIDSSFVYPTTLFYNAKHGIISFIMSDGKHWIKE